MTAALDPARESALHALRSAAAHADTPDARLFGVLIAARACRNELSLLGLSPDHLWRDLGLDGRDAVSAMLDRYFPALAARNVTHLRWKKFLALEVAASLGAPPGPAPGCPGCEDFGFCFPRAR
ncbi:nitrogen fixation protein NifQ [Burkholderia seminalis]|uniref:nitrogen fixation protein NifQ n=1 Tax=Burkholderia seminalis TaxID=488731 RepID=UPI000757F02F|nr:nitrogen fixation protein NifQ [Burkholderia seminalis]AOJ26969.1 hypothetical protein WJ12_18950 [Burkholderia seminalis]KVF42678.1 hypothetical protein WJ13_33090 [Burkholderia seminalis]MCA8038106.1 nitrogen fixation protein NifQ [Burkholderia seminalis]